jgi:hypothetical protein
VGNFFIFRISCLKFACLIFSLIQQKLFEAKPPFTVVVFSEGTGLQNILLFGLRQSQGILTTFQARYLGGIFFLAFTTNRVTLTLTLNSGDYFSSISLLDRLSMQQRGFPLRETKCNCRYDVLRENILIEKNDDGQFIPATLVIDVEWNLEGVASINPKDKKNVKFNYLFPPPSKAAASLVCFCHCSNETMINWHFRSSSLVGKIAASP